MNAITESGMVLGVAVVCAALGIARASYYRHLKPKRPAARKTSPRRLADEERAAVLAVLHEPRFADLAPAEVYATLLDEGGYLCSERTMYRVLAENSEVRERRNQLRHPRYAPPELLATCPNQLWSWDITKAPRPRQVDLLLSLRHPRRVQPLRRGMDGRAPRDRRLGRAAHRGDLPPPADHARAAHHPR
jgi:putative transposase